MADSSRRKNPAKRLRLEEIHINFGMLDFSTTCVVGPFAGVQKYLMWKFDDDEAAISTTEPRGRVYIRPGYAPVIWIPQKPRTPREYGTLAHEVLHVVHCLMLWANIRISDESEEAYCHALAYGVTEILEALK